MDAGALIKRGDLVGKSLGSFVAEVVRSTGRRLAGGTKGFVPRQAVIGIDLGRVKVLGSNLESGVPQLQSLFQNDGETWEWDTKV